MLTQILVALAALGALGYAYLVMFKLTYWKRKGVPHTPTSSFMGHFGPLIRSRTTLVTLLKDLAAPHRENGYCGVYQWSKPILLVWEPELIKQIVTKDFSSFHDRGLPQNEDDPLSQHLFNPNGTKWRNLRNKLSPTFTSGKLKQMLPLMLDIGNEMSDVVAAEAKSSPTHEVNMCEVLSRYATDVIGSVAFGVQCNSLKDKNSEFFQMVQRVFRDGPRLLLIRTILTGIHPGLTKLVPLKLLLSHANNFFLSLMKDTVEYREKKDIHRNDFVQLMMALRKADLSSMDPENYMELTPGVMAAQGFIFFVAGLDNVANTIAFCLKQMAADPKLQDRVVDEIMSVLKQNNGELSYEAIKKMELLNGVAMEGLRMWSPVGNLIRKCNETTRVGDVMVEKGQSIMISTSAVHCDERYYPDPERFDPERFVGANKESIRPYTYLPFGEGPRICIAERFAMLELKLAIAMLLRDFVFTPGPKFQRETPTIPGSIVPRPLGGIYLKVSTRS